MRAITVLLSLSLVLLAACAKNEEKRYDLKGEVVKVDAATQVATIKHEKLGDWMEAMTMDFPVKPKAEFDKLAPGDQVTGVVIVRGMDYHLTDVKTAARKGDASK